MDTLSKFFWVLVIVIMFIASFKVFPIYYNYLSIRSICQEQADRYHKYNKAYINKRIEEQLQKLEIPKNQRSHSITVTDEAVYIDIYYKDVANFFDKYQKNFTFNHRCEGVISSVLD